MPYVSCRYAPPSPFPDAPQMILCTDDQGVEWTVHPDSEVGDWLRFKEEGGEITPFEPPPEPEVDDPDAA